MKLVCGVGINDFKIIGIKSTGTPEHKLWCGMLSRCYHRYPINSPYIGCTVSENFKSLVYFHKWVNEQVGFLFKDENGLNWQLDKDIVGNGLVYSESVCCFVPRKINTLLTQNKTTSLKIPGVHYSTRDRKFYAACCDGKGVPVFIGLYKNRIDAFIAYRQRKEEVVKGYAREYAGLVDDRVTEALLNYSVPVPDILAGDISL